MEADGPSTMSTTGFGHSMHGEIPRDLELALSRLLDLGRLEGERGELGCVRRSRPISDGRRAWARACRWKRFSMLASTVDLVASFSSNITVPVTFWN